MVPESIRKVLIEESYGGGVDDGAGIVDLFVCLRFGVEGQEESR